MIEACSPALFYSSTWYAFPAQITDDLSSLIVVNFQSGELFAVDPETGKATLIDLGGDLIVGGDGIVRHHFVVARFSDLCSEWSVLLDCQCFPSYKVRCCSCDTMYAGTLGDLRYGLFWYEHS